MILNASDRHCYSVSGSDPYCYPVSGSQLHDSHCVHDGSTFFSSHHHDCSYDLTVFLNHDDDCSCDCDYNYDDDDDANLNDDGGDHNCESDSDSYSVTFPMQQNCLLGGRFPAYSTRIC